MYLSGETDGVRHPAAALAFRPLRLRDSPSSMARGGLSRDIDTGVRGKGERSISSPVWCSVDGVLGSSYSEVGGDGYEPLVSLKPWSAHGIRVFSCSEGFIEGTWPFDPLLSELETDVRALLLISLKREEAARRERRPLHLRGLAVAYLGCQKLRSSTAEAA